MPAPTARSVCLDALREWERGESFADDILHDLVTRHQLSMVDRAFLTEVFYGILRHLGQIDFLIERLGRTDVDSQTKQVLRLGIYQIFYMRIPDHAAVNETVDLAGRARSLVNALLRRSIREQPSLNEALAAASLPVRKSHPDFIVDRWRKTFGEEETMKLCDWNNTPPDVFIRANTLKVTPGELARASGNAEPVDFHPLALRVHQIPFLWIASGLCYVQDPSTLMAVDLLDPKPGERVLDACAAPGGKASYIAALMKNEGDVVAADTSPKRIGQLGENMDRLGATIIRIIQQNWLKPGSALDATQFDRILLDTPCTNTGVMRRRVDVRWRLRPDDFARMSRRQCTLVANVLPRLKRGGTLVYSTCSLEPEENEEVVEAITARFPSLKLVATRQCLPFRDGVDGAFAARFEAS